MGREHKVRMCDSFGLADTMSSTSQSSHSKAPLWPGLWPLVWISVKKLVLLPREPVAKDDEVGRPRDELGSKGPEPSGDGHSRD